MSDLDKRLKIAVAKRDQLSTSAQRIIGRKEAADKALAEVEQEIKDKNLDPATLDETVSKFEEALETEVTQIEAGVAQAHADLQPYLEIS